jgi:glutamine synthetase
MHDKPYAFALKTDTGFGDLLARPDPSTFRRVPWENNIPFFLVDFLQPTTGQPLSICPRGLLKSILARILNETAGRGVAGVEFEWYNYLGRYKVFND